MSLAIPFWIVVIWIAVLLLSRFFSAAYFLFRRFASHKKCHRLKSWPICFKAVREGIKPFEVRVDDRNFQPGDFVVLEEWDSDQSRYTGRSIRREITFVLTHGNFDAVPDGWCVLGLRSF